MCLCRCAGILLNPASACPLPSCDPVCLHQFAHYAPQDAQLCLQLFTPDVRGWARAQKDSNAVLNCPSGGLAKLFLQYHSEGRHRRLSDFDDHLNDPSK